MFYILLLLVGCVFCELDRLHGWNYINLHCRDNINTPVDWWILYKPPGGDYGPHLQSGRNFTYISSETTAKWQHSDRYITGNSMLQNTIAPMFRPTYSDYLGIIEYSSKIRKDDHAGSSTMGIMLADEMGGVWIRHTVPGLPDFTQDRSYFPQDEIKNGHMIMCLSLDLVTLNEISRYLRQVEPEILAVRVPPAVRQWLPDWQSISDPPKNTLVSKSLKKLEFDTKAKSLRAYLMARRPGDKRCLYKTFAKDKKIVLDVYGHDKSSKAICEKTFSVRNIDAISLKFTGSVYYITNKTDRLSFAVSTGAHWQRKGGSSTDQYWTCTGTVEMEDGSGKGGLIICIEEYQVWRIFDTLKIKEPEC